jgi:alcohol dehydrogenase/propanol-preferring alcohol dehydrogenase
MFGGSLTVPLMKMSQLGLTLRGSYVGNPKELRELLALAQSGTLAPIPVSTVPKHEVTQALERLARGEVHGRVVLEDG